MSGEMETLRYLWRNQYGRAAVLALVTGLILLVSIWTHYRTVAPLLLALPRKNECQAAVRAMMR